MNHKQHHKLQSTKLDKLDNSILKTSCTILIVGYQWLEEKVGWTSAIVYNLLSGLNVTSFKAKSYLDQGYLIFFCFKFIVSFTTWDDVSHERKYTEY